MMAVFQQVGVNVWRKGCLPSLHEGLCGEGGWRAWRREKEEQGVISALPGQGLDCMATPGLKTRCVPRG